jgi:2-succinyl-6-hydroxy-2,4-cyclohexadiene-1-carboxylate synthase
MNESDFPHCVISGREGAPILVFLHGFLGDLRDWSEIAPGLENEFRCVALDLPGHGRTPLPGHVRVDGGMQAIADWFWKTMDGLGVGSCSIAGYSMGGRLALCAALTRPERVTALAVESASPGLRSEEERLIRIRQDEELADRLARTDFSAFLKSWCSQQMFAGIESDVERFATLLHRRMDNNPARIGAALRVMSIGRQPDLWGLWEKNRIPTLIICGERDEKYCAIGHEMAALCDASRLIITPGSGHNVHYMDSKNYAASLSAFFHETAGKTQRAK